MRGHDVKQIYIVHVSVISTVIVANIHSYRRNTRTCCAVCFLGLVLQFLVLASFFRPVDLSAHDAKLHVDDEPSNGMEPHTLDDQHVRQSTQQRDLLPAVHVNDVAANCVSQEKNVAANTQNDVTRTKLEKYGVVDVANSDENSKHSEVDISTRCGARHGITKSSSPNVTHRVSSFIKRTWDFTLLRNVRFLLYILNLALGEYVIACMYRFTPLRAINDGISEQDVAFLPSCIAICSFTFRSVQLAFALHDCVHVCKKPVIDYNSFTCSCY